MVHDEPVHPDSFVKIFNCYKNATTDRQIGDIRGQNSIESRLVGPSRELPAGPQEVTCRTSQIPEVLLEPNGPQRFLSPTFLDTLPSHFQYSGPGVPWSMLEGTKGYANFLLTSCKKKKASREARFFWDPMLGLQRKGAMFVLRKAFFGHLSALFFKATMEEWRYALMPM